MPPSGGEGEGERESCQPTLWVSRKNSTDKPGWLELGSGGGGAHVGTCITDHYRCGVSRGAHAVVDATAEEGKTYSTLAMLACDGFGDIGVSVCESLSSIAM